MRKNLRGILGFSKREMNGVLLLIPLILFFLFLPSLYGYFFPPDYDNTVDQQLLDSLVSLFPDPAEGNDHEELTEFFLFDPNVISADSLMRLGIPGFLSKRIVNYRKAGGRFRRPEDLKKIYGFPDSLFVQLRPFIQVSTMNSSPPDSRVVSKKKEVNESIKRVFTDSVSTKATPKPLIVDINSADTMAFKQLYGIGSVYAGRIIKYRNLLGGYVSTQQLTEVYGLSDSLLNQIAPFLIIGDSSVHKIPINLATFKELNAHPYISFEQTKEVFNQKSKLGKYRSATDLFNLKTFDSAQVYKLLPYLDFK